MKKSKNSICRRYHAAPTIAFEQHQLTSFSGLQLFSTFFERIALVNRLKRSVGSSGQYGLYRIIFILLIHFTIGFRRIRSLDHYRHDPLVKRIAGVDELPSISTISRALASSTESEVSGLRRLSRQLVHEDIVRAGLHRITHDFDGSVISTRRKAEMTAVGFNKKKKGARSYYPLFCTIAQTGQVVDSIMRAGNVHDSNGARKFAEEILKESRSKHAKALLEARFDGAFFSQDIISMLDNNDVEFSASVPFLRLTELKTFIEERERWRNIDEKISWFEMSWKPKSWEKKYRFIFVRKTVEMQNKNPIQLDVFEPIEFGKDYKVIVTNKEGCAADVIAFHEGRGAQEGIFAELKSQNALDYIPFKTLNANIMYMTSAILSHNLSRSLQIATGASIFLAAERKVTGHAFNGIEMLRNMLIRRAGKLTKPHGKLKLTISGDEKFKERYLDLERLINKAA
jgi:hypothetical protein